MRQSGYYWVKYDGKWIVAEFEYFLYKNGDEYKIWQVAGLELSFYDNEFDEIDETRIERKTTEQ